MGGFSVNRMRLALVVALSFATLVQGQVGVTICACQPSIYTFRFNFSAFCEIQTIDSRPGVLGADCFARGFGLGSENTVDVVPVKVTEVKVMEIDKELRVIAQTPYIANFRDGDTFTYTSLAASLEGIATLTPERMPGGIQLDIVGINQLEEPITNVWVILFDNDCNIFPVLEKGDQIGWTILDDLTNPLQEVCPLAPPPIEGSLAPAISAIPSTARTVEPTRRPAMAEPTLPPNPPNNGTPICVPSKGKGKGKGEMTSSKASSISKANGKGGKGGKGGGSYGSDDRSGKGGKAGGSADKHSGSGKGGKGGSSSKKTGNQHPTLHQYLKFYGFGAMPRKAGSNGDECIELPEKKTNLPSQKSKITKIEKGKGKGKGSEISSKNSGSSDSSSGKGGTKSKQGKGKGKGYKSYSNSKGKAGKGLMKKSKDKEDSKEKYRDSVKDSPLLSASSKGKGGKGKGGKGQGGTSNASKAMNGKGGGKGASGSMDYTTNAPAQQPNSILLRNSAEEPALSPTPAPSIMTMFTINMEFLAQSKKKWQEYLEKQNNNRLRK